MIEELLVVLLILYVLIGFMGFLVFLMEGFIDSDKEKIRKAPWLLLFWPKVARNYYDQMED